MSFNELPPDIFSNITSTLIDPKDWINCMGSCKSWKEILYPLYLRTMFRVAIVFKSNDYTSECKFRLKQYEEVLVTNQTLIDCHFMWNFWFDIKIYLVPGLYLPFMSIVDHKIKINTNKMTKYYLFKFPIQNKRISDIIQEISLQKTKYVVTNFNYGEVLIREINTYYNSNSNLIGTSRHRHDLNAVTQFRGDQFLAGSDALCCLRYFFRKNRQDICPICLQTHYPKDAYSDDKYLGDKWEYSYPIEEIETFESSDSSSGENDSVLIGIDLGGTHTIGFGHNNVAIGTATHTIGFGHNNVAIGIATQTLTNKTIMAYPTYSNQIISDPWSNSWDQPNTVYINGQSINTMFQSKKTKPKIYT